MQDKNRIKIIIGYLIMAVKQNPELRFEQLLYNLGIVDTDKDYNLESSDTCDKIFNNATKLNIIDFNIKDK